ncbi:sulfurtransferase-like selenium metabolism protein YedF [Intestinibacillus massiliensis]|nr:sulfurtransferase-like selenium metabolism protein YedF [Intestinibacillus massiliensis]MCC2864384.1 sulfurtransferase-like selenium metabolism protein YedF [Anaerovorax odorimutans]
MSETKKIAIMIAADVIGAGDEELGHNLMKSYIYSLTEADVKPETIMFLNKGVYLTTKNSPVLDLIKQLEADGVEILSCGACLDFYQLNDGLEVGTVTNMYSNVEIMHEADNTIVIS